MPQTRLGPEDRGALTHIERRRRTELMRLRDQIKRAQHRVDLLRIERDSRLYYWHEEDGMSIDLLSNAAGITRQGAYDAIERFRKQLAEGGAN